MEWFVFYLLLFYPIRNGILKKIIVVNQLNLPRLEILGLSETRMYISNFAGVFQSDTVGTEG